MPRPLDQSIGSLIRGHRIVFHLAQVRRIPTLSWHWFIIGVSMYHLYFFCFIDYRSNFRFFSNYMYSAHQGQGQLIEISRIFWWKLIVRNHCQIKSFRKLISEGLSVFFKFCFLSQKVMQNISISSQKPMIKKTRRVYFNLITLMKKSSTFHICIPWEYNMLIL